ncbi:MAG: hypothetical protein IPG63_01770 [Xanthomonadales bacterium]|nr:hypothetical protein [Xanthomonadales bacterium]
MPSILTRCIHLLMLFLLPLCAGAVWSVAMQLTHRDLPFASLMMPAVLLLMRGQLGFLTRGTRLLLHGLAAFAGIAYAQALAAGVIVAQQFGYGPMETLHAMGVAMTLDLVLVRSTALDWLAAAIAIALSMAIGAGRRAASTPVTPRSVP